jgi:hypothetical protein
LLLLKLLLLLLLFASPVLNRLSSSYESEF